VIVGKGDIEKPLNNIEADNFFKMLYQVLTQGIADFLRIPPELFHQCEYNYRDIAFKFLSCSLKVNGCHFRGIEVLATFFNTF
jgi:hypothetical protein